LLNNRGIVRCTVPDIKAQYNDRIPTNGDKVLDEEALSAQFDAPRTPPVVLAVVDHNAERLELFALNGWWGAEVERVASVLLDEQAGHVDCSALCGRLEALIAPYIDQRKKNTGGLLRAAIAGLS
jgi:hypothetical protein